MTAYIEYWNKLKEDLPPEKWGRYNEKYLVSNLGRVKDAKTKEFIIPFLVTPDSRAVIRRNKEIIGVGRMVAAVFIKGSHLTDKETVYRKSGLIHECYSNCFEVISRKEQRRRARALGTKTLCKECAKVDENGEIIEIYSSQREAGRKNYICITQINDVCKGRLKSASGEIFRNTNSLF